MRSIWKIALVWGIVGVVVAAPLFGITGYAEAHTAPHSDGLLYYSQNVMLFLWPASFWLMATENASTAVAVEIVGMDVLANFVLYFVVGLILAFLWRISKRLAARARQKTAS